MAKENPTIELLSRLKELDVEIWVENDKLRIDAPKGVIDSTLHQELFGRKEEILKFIADSAVLIHNDRMFLRTVSRAERLPLSFSQERLWFLQQLEPESIAYSMPGTIRLRGALDVEALTKSFYELARRHEALRTTFRVVNGLPEQVIASEPSFSPEVTDLRYLPEDGREDEVLRLTELESKRPFDLVQGPLCRVSLYRLGEEDHVLHVNMHHMISDYWSIEVINREFVALYTALITGTPPQLPELSVQYADFANCQRQWLQGEVLEAHLSYWKEKLGGELATLALPTDRPRPAVQTHHGASHSLEIPKSLAESLRRLSRGKGVSLFMVLLAAFKVLLYRHSGQEDIIVGTPIAGRNRVELERLIGFFINTVVMRTDLSGNPGFDELITRVRDTAFEAYAHQEMPFEKLVEELAPERDLSRTPIFQVFINHIRVDDKRLALPGLQAEVVTVIERESAFDMTLYILEQRDTICVSALYNVDLFDAQRIEIMLAQYEALLAQVVANPDEKITHYQLHTSAEEKLLPDQTEPIAHQWAGAVSERFSDRARQAPEQTAIIDAWSSWSYGELEHCSNQLAKRLHADGIKSGEVVAIYGHRSAVLVLALLGVLKAGAAFLILDPAYPAIRLVRMLQGAGASGWLQLEAAGAVADDVAAYVVGTGVKSRVKLPWTPAEVGEAMGGISETAPELLVSSEDTAYIAFTSASTGEPKGIIGTHSPLSHFIDWHCRQFGFNSSDRFSMLSGLSHDPLLRDIFTPLWVGGTLCIPDPDEMFIPHQFRKWMRTQQISVAHMTPALGQILTEMDDVPEPGEERLPALRHVFFGGDVLTWPQAHRMREVAPAAECVNFYGTTETPQAMGYHVVDFDQADTYLPQIPLGSGVDGVQLLVVNGAGRLAGIGEFGEIHVRTPYLARGYLNDDRLTRERFVVNPLTGENDDRLYKTGDLGRYRPDGKVAFYGRGDRQVSIRGFRVELKEIESILAIHPDIKECAVASRVNDMGNRYLVGYVVAKTSGNSSSGELRVFLQDSLPSYMIPSVFIFLDSLPLTPHRKVNYQALPEPDWIQPDLQDTVNSPQTKNEKTLAEIWCNVLGLEAVGIFENFFELGGNSLLSVRLVSGINAKLNVQIPLRSLFLNPTVASLAKLIDNYPKKKNRLYKTNHASRKNSVIFPIQPKGNKRPLFVIAGAHERDEDFLRYLANLVSSFGIEQPIYGLRPRGSNMLDRKSMTVEKMAQIYIEKIRNIQKSGPYLILGECVGGIVAYELACQLQALGHKLAMLVIMDTPFPKKNTIIWYRIYFIKRRLLRIMEALGGIMMLDRSAVNKVKSKLKQWGTIETVSKDAGGISIKRDNPSFDYRLILYRYKPRPFFGDLTFICNEDRYSKNSKIGWENVVKKRFELLVVPGNHLTRLTKHGKIIAQNIMDCIEKTEGLYAKKKLKETINSKQKDLTLNHLYAETAPYRFKL